MESITSFISELASYYWHENDLSNITVTLCNSNVTFKVPMLGTGYSHVGNTTFPRWE